MAIDKVYDSLAMVPNILNRRRKIAYGSHDLSYLAPLNVMLLHMRMCIILADLHKFYQQIDFDDKDSLPDQTLVRLL